MKSKLLFLDTEFTDFIDIELISIGLVSEDRLHEFYGEVRDFGREKCSSFVQSAVLPLLGQAGDSAIINRAELGERLRIWFAEITAPVRIAYDYPADWHLLVDALDGELPDNVVGHDNLASIAGSAAYRLAAASYHSAPNRPWHHALYDARANRAGWLAWKCNDLQARIPGTDRRGRRTHLELEDVPAPYRDEFTAWLALMRKPGQKDAADSAVRRSAWREWLIFRFSSTER